MRKYFVYMGAITGMVILFISLLSVLLMSQHSFKNKPLAERQRLVRQIMLRMLEAYRLKNTNTLATKLGYTVGAINN
ncbi:MAG: Tfp pilus assembly protein PilV [Alteromonadaceae bacterium]|jgi:Tfp pilus assembly protein PilV